MLVPICCAKCSYQEERWRVDFGRRWWLGPKTASADGPPLQNPVCSDSGSAVSGSVWPGTAGAAPGPAGHLIRIHKMSQKRGHCNIRPKNPK